MIYELATLASTWYTDAILAYNWETIFIVLNAFCFALNPSFALLLGYLEPSPSTYTAMNFDIKTLVLFYVKPIKTGDELLTKNSEPRIF